MAQQQSRQSQLGHWTAMHLMCRPTSFYLLSHLSLYLFFSFFAHFLGLEVFHGVHWQKKHFDYSSIECCAVICESCLRNRLELVV